MQNAAAIVHGDVTSIRTWPVTRSTSTPQKSKMKPWQSDELISSASVGAVSSGGVQKTVSRMRLDFIRQQAGRPMARGGDARERDRAHPGCRCREDLAAREDEIFRRDIELRGGDPREPVAQLRRRKMRRAGDRRGEAARVVAGCDRPGILGRVEVGR